MVGHRGDFARRKTSWCKDEVQLSEQRRLLCARNHRGRSGRHGLSLFERFLRRARRVAGYRSRSSQRRSEGASHPICLRTLWKTRRRHDRECDYLSWKISGSRNRQSLCLSIRKLLARLASLVSAWEYKDSNDTLERHFQDAGFDLKHPKIRKFFELCVASARSAPRHLGQHSGGLVVLPGAVRLCSSAGTPRPCPTASSFNGTKKIAPTWGTPSKSDLLGLGMDAGRAAKRPCSSSGKNTAKKLI